MLTPQDAASMLTTEVIKEGIKFLYGVAASTLEKLRSKKANSTEASDRDNTNIYSNEAADAEQIVLPADIASKLDLKAAAIEKENITALLKQIEIHNMNLNHFETQKTTFGQFTPPYIETGILTEKSALIEKGRRLRAMLEHLYGTHFDLPSFD